MSQRFQKIFSDISRDVSLQYFERYVLASSQHVDQLFVAIRACRTQNFPRFNIWRMLLQIVPINGGWEDKKKALQEARNRWLQLKQQSKEMGDSPLPIKKQTQNVPKNPLMMKMAKPEKKQADQYSLSEQIKKDVDRTYQEMTFFQDKQIMKLLSDILYVWCKINSDVSYKQGMNEVLASIVYVYFQEAVPANFEASNELEEKYLILNTTSYIEADIYVVFEKIMEIQKDMYKQNLDEELKDKINPNSKNNTPILKRIIALQDQRLKSIDLELFRVLRLQNIQDSKTKTFLLRWIRCMHTREFGIDNSLYIWDSMFLDSYECPNSKSKKQYEFMDAMCLAMFIYMRAVVLTRQTANEILQIYSKYPSLEGPYLFQLIRLAWSVCDQLRNQISNPGGNSDWYEDSAKVRKLGLMEKQASSIGYNKPEAGDKYHGGVKDVQLSSPSEKIESFSQKVESNGSSKQKVDVLSRGNQQPKDKKNSSEDVFFKPSPSISRKEDSLSSNFGSGSILFEEKELSDLIQTLKHSVNLNSDIQSKVLSNKVLKALESKLKK